MELLEGGDLKDAIIDLGSMVVGESLRIMDQILEGLDAAHQKGIVHCDIKPHNILFATDGSVRISDFGFARSISFAENHGNDKGLSQEFAPMSGGAGTPDYASPELMSGGLPDPRADLYSAGVVMFEMLTGHVPFSSNPTTFYSLLMVR
jgi:serine/threonine-protein kinase